MIKLADYVINRLAEEGIDKIFVVFHVFIFFSWIDKTMWC
jgi:hypothetical protein